MSVCHERSLNDTANSSNKKRAVLVLQETTVQSHPITEEESIGSTNTVDERRSSIRVRRKTTHCSSEDTRGTTDVRRKTDVHKQ